MKFFSEIEKKTIKLILSYNDKEQYNCLFNILFDIEDQIIAPVTMVNIFHKRKDDTSIEFAYGFLNLNDARHIQIETVSKLYTVISLLKYLINEGYLFFVKNNDELNYRSSSDGFIEFDILDDNLKKDLFYFDTGYLIPSYSLYQLVRDEFKTPEVVYKERRQEWQTEQYKQLLKLVQDRADNNQKEMEKTTNRYRRITMAISIIAFIAPLCVAVISLISPQKVSLLQTPTINLQQSFLRFPLFW